MLYWPAVQPLWRSGIQQDIDLMREIMLRIESTKNLNETPHLKFTDYASDHVDFNLYLLINAGFVEGNVTKTMGGVYVIYVEHLTWDGFELLNSIRHDSIMDSVKTVIRDKGLDVGAVAIRLVAELAMAEMRRLVGL